MSDLKSGRIILLAFFLGVFLGAIGGSSGTYLLFNKKGDDRLSERRESLAAEEREIIKKQEKTREDFYEDVITINKSNYVITLSNQIISW